VRLIYTDESGTSPDNRVRVVASIVVHGDDQWRNLTAEIDRVVRESVPDVYQGNFHFHGNELFSRSGKYFDENIWSFDDRADFFKEFVCLPFVHDVPIAVGIVFKDTFANTELEGLVASRKGVRMHHLEHLIAFQHCMERADEFLKKYLNGSEIGTVIAEDTKEMRKFLSEGGLQFRDRPVHVPGNVHRPEAWQTVLGVEPEAVTYEINHIIDVPHFVEKRRAPLLQLSDACSYAFYRCLLRKEHGSDFVLAMLGPEHGQDFVSDPVWYTQVSAGLFNTSAYWSSDQQAQYAANALAVARRRASLA
jgi:hypothetical protein